MNITINNQSDYILVIPEGSLDSLTSEEFNSKVLPYASMPKPLILLDFSGLSYISSAGLRSILLLIKQVQENKGRIAGLNLNKLVKEIIQISGFDTLMKFYNSIGEAILGT
jgi:anti-anti-sigma factor